jgi:hypothetical protein
MGRAAPRGCGRGPGWCARLRSATGAAPGGCAAAAVVRHAAAGPRAVGELAAKVYARACDGVFDREDVLFHRDGLVLSVQLDAGVVAVGVFDDAKQTFMRAFADGDGFADELVAAHGSGWWHGTSVCARLYHGRVHLRQVWSRSLNTTTLGSHRCDVGAADNKNAIVLCLFSVLDKKEVPVDVENTALA